MEQNEDDRRAELARQAFGYNPGAERSIRDRRAVFGAAVGESIEKNIEANPAAEKEKMRIHMRDIERRKRLR